MLDDKRFRFPIEPHSINRQDYRQHGKTDGETDCRNFQVISIGEPAHQCANHAQNCGKDDEQQVKGF